LLSSTLVRSTESVIYSHCVHMYVHTHVVITLRNVAGGS